MRQAHWSMKTIISLLVTVKMDLVKVLVFHAGRGLGVSLGHPGVVDKGQQLVEDLQQLLLP